MITTIEAVTKFVSTSPSQDEWILFDIDYTLTAPTQSTLHFHFLKAHKQRWKEEFSTFSPEEKQLLPTLMVSHVPNRLIEESSPLLIRQLQENGYILFGFTAADTSLIPTVGSFPEWREQELQRLSINFTQPIHSPLPQKPLLLTQFPSLRKSYPLYRNGILYTNATSSKGEILGAFIDAIDHSPHRVILVDDMKENLQTVERELSRRGIAFLGLHYMPDYAISLEFDHYHWQMTWNELRERARSPIP